MFSFQKVVVNVAVITSAASIASSKEFSSFYNAYEFLFKLEKPKLH